LSKRRSNHINKEGSKMKSKEAHRLCRGELIRLNGNVAGSISCREGVLWLTQTDNPGDHLIQAGEAFSIGHPGAILISALEDSVYAVEGGSIPLFSFRSFRPAPGKMARLVKSMLKRGLLA
jgi:hypothetical protein